MTSPPDDTTTDLHAVIAALRSERDAALSEKAALAEELATRDAALTQRNAEFGERIEHQTATIDVLKAMSASPGDAQPVFDLITHRARQLCDGVVVGLTEFDGELVHMRSASAVIDPGAHEAVMALFPMRPVRGFIVCRAILERQLIHIRDAYAEPDLLQHVRNNRTRSILAIPLMRDDTVIGSIALNSMEPGGFSENQVELLKTFAEQAVIAITSAETYRALQTRTSDLQETLEYQTATSDVLKVISRSTFDLQPVLDTVVETAARLCDADMAAIGRPVGDLWRLVANFGFPPEFEAEMRARGAYPLDPDSPTVAGRAVRERRAVHIHDAATVPGYPDRSIRLGKQRTSLGVPLLREGEVIGHIVLARQRVEPFTDRQIELVSTFADQAVIAIENTRLITEQKEALEQQTATAEVLQVINSSPGNLTPVFEAMLEKAIRLCGGDRGVLWTIEGGRGRIAAARGLPAEFVALLRERGESGTNSPLQRVVQGEWLIEFPDTVEEFSRSGDPHAKGAVEAGVRSAIWVAIVKEGVTVGAFAIGRSVIGTFSDKQIALLQNFAAQAVIAMENARLITEQREALEQQTATAEVLQVINASPGNLAPVFDAMLEKAMRLCGAAYGVLRSFDGARLGTLASRGVPAEYADFLVRNAEPHIPASNLRGTALTRALQTGQPAQILDVRESIAYKSGSPRGHAIADLGGARTILHVPLVKDTVSIGLFTIYRQEVRGFSDKEIALVDNFAAQAVIAMENARLITEQREALEQQTATAEVLQVINASPGDLAPVFDAILEKAHGLCGIAMGSLELYDGQRFRAVAVRGSSDTFADMLRQGYPASENPVTRLLIDGGRLTHIRDLAETDYAITRSAAELNAARTLLCVPLRREGTLLGMIASARKEVRPFSDKEIALLENFAAQAVVAMENARLLTEQREALDRQTATAEVLQVINSSPGNLMPVFDAILEKAHRLCGADVGALGFYDGAMFRSVAMHGFPEAHAARARQPWVPTPHQDPLVRGERMVHVADLKAEGPEWDNDITRSANAGTAIRTGLWLPLRKDGVLQGYISSFRNSVRPFSDNEISLLENFAEQAVIAIENARLLNEIQQRQEELRITFENMGDGVAMFDEMQHLIAWNRKFQDILDVPDDIIARRQTFSEYIRYLAERGEYGADADVEEQVRRLLETAGQMRVFERVRPNGRVIEVRSNPVARGGFVLIYADITERKRNEAEVRAARDAAEEASRTIEAAYRDLKAAQANLIQAEKMASLGQLTAGIAHEIKNPLNFVNNFSALSTELIDELRDVLAPEPLGETARTEVDDLTALLKGNLEKVVQHGQRADGIVRSMLDHSRGSSGERRMVDLNALIDEALNLAYHGARAQDQSFNITLERDFGEGISPIEVNPQDITRVFLNLFSNGFYATTKRARHGADAAFVPTLKVTTIDAGDAVEIRVRDNGIGIPTDIRDKLFQPFFTTKPTGEGTGLGLSITYDIVTQQHAGSIAVDSKVGDYSEFTIRLPRNP